MLGSPIRHSLSPVLHAAAYRELGLTDWSYDAIECDEGGLAGLLDSLGPEWAGLSLTMPLKRAVLPLLDEAEQLVTDVGGANTVLLRAGQRAGYNTDVPGMVAALREAGVDLSDGAGVSGGPGRSGGPGPSGAAGASGGTGPPGGAGVSGGARPPGGAGVTDGIGDAGISGSVLVLGGGATACSALAALRRAEASDVCVAVRDAGRAGPVLEVAARLGVRIRLAGLTAGGVQTAGAGSSADGGLAAGGGAFRLLISTVPVGVADGVAGQIAAGNLATEAVFDVVYDPWPTALAAAAMTVGSTVISGFELLLHQAAGQVELMTGQRAPLAAMSAAGLGEIARRAAR